jgi:hypothetical protein
VLFAQRLGQFLGPAAIVFLSSGIVGAQQPRLHALPTTREIPNAFGTTSYTVTTISATAFIPDSNDVGFGVPAYFTSGSLGRFSQPDQQMDYFTALELPAGAVIDFIGLNSTTDTPFILGVELVRRDKFGGLNVVGSLDSTVHGWDTDRNLSPIGYLWNGRFDEALIMHVQQATSPNNQFFGWVEVWWKRSVSPAPGVASFNDVPTGHPLFQFVEALKASGITGGCQSVPPLYCPDAALTRGQMAVFLAKALGLHWPAN